MKKSRHLAFAAFMIAFAVSVTSWPVLKTTADDAASAAARRVVEQKFDGTFFDARRDPSADAAQIRLTRILKNRIEAIDRSCGLDDSQTKKLELAGRGAIKRLIESIAEQKQAFVSEGRDIFGATKYLHESPEILALRKNLRDGPFGEDSLFAKTIASILTQEQAAIFGKRAARATGSNRTIAPANVGDLVRIAEIKKDVYRVAWDRDGKHLGCLEYNNQLEVYVPLADQPVRIVGQGARVLGFDFSLHADSLATLHSPGIVTVLSLSDSKKFEIQTGPGQSSLKFSPDGKTIVTAGYGTKAYLWSIATRELVREFALGTRDGGLTPAFTPDGKILALGNRNSTTGLFDVATGKLVNMLGRSMSHDLRFNPSGDTLAVVYVDGQLVLWDVQTGKLKQSIQAWADELYTVDWTPDGRMLVTGGYNSQLTFWDSTDLSTIAEFESPERIMSARFSPDGTKLIFSGQNRSPENRYVETWAVP